ncbi:uncharacterized protein UTRI_01670_B [Ustilago trichophora]|uniref:Uncharacterized protein n=1 Tax=Ustilago trichophora TaxID=86804 RepID=A0A5C3E2I0_9BASI|nr:uncharacterized protein UTRI_01670_B [Ustilago trichophora]
MPFADLLRRPSTRSTVDPHTPTASTSYHGTNSSSLAASSSSSKPRSSPSARERFTFGRTSKTHSTSTANTDGDILYPTRQLQTSYNSSNRASHYSTTDEHGIGEAPSHAPSSKRPSAAPSPAPSPLPQNQPLPGTASSLATTTATTTTSSHVNQYDRLFGLAGSSTSVSPRRTPAPLPSIAPPTSSTRSTPISSALANTESPSTEEATTAATTAAPTSTTLLRRKSTKSRSPFPPASSSTGTSSTHRDRTTMGSAIFRRPSLRRRTGSADSSASRTEKMPPSPSPAATPTAELKATTSNVSSTTAAPASIPISTSTSAAATTSTGRFARLFGRRKSISSPTNFTHLSKPDLLADPVPALQDASFSVNKQSPPLAVISAAGWQDPAEGAKPLDDANRPVSPRTVSHKDVSPSANELGANDASSKSKTNDSESSNVSAFTFPARTSFSNDSAHKQLSTTDSMRSRQAKHSTSRSLPLTSLPISNPIPLSASPDSTHASAIPIPQSRPSKLGRSLSHRKNSKSLSMLGSIFGGGGGGGSQTHSASSSPPLPQAAATLSQRYPAPENRTSQTADASTSSLSRRPSLRSRLKMGRSTAEPGPQRPTTPEIESWKQKPNDPVDGVSADTRRSRASIDSPFRPKPAEVPVKITRSKSMIRRKPPPEIKQDEIDSSSSTPVYSRTFRTLEVDQHTGSPLGGSPASSPEAQFATLAGSSPKLGSALTVSHDSQYKQSRSQAGDVNGLGLIGASEENANASVPSIDIRPSTPSRDTSPIVATEVAGSQVQQKLAPNASPSLGGKRLSSGMHSVADTSLSVDRPWSLISAGDADTPLLKLRKLVVNTNASDDSRDDDDASDGLFFRPLTGASRNSDEADKAQPDAEKMMDAIENAEVLSEGDAEQLRSSSQTTTRSDTKHEIASIHSSGSSTLRPTRSVAAQPSISGLSATSGALSDATSQASTVRMRNIPTSLVEAAEQNPAVTVDADSISPLPAKSPAASQHSFRTRQHRRDGSTGSAFSQSTVQQARRASTASRLTTRSSGHWSESRHSEDALSALEAEVGQARRAEVVALGKGRVKDWVADRPLLPTTEAPTLSRSNTLRKKAQAATTAPTTEVSEKEAQRQKALNEHLSRRLQQLSDAQVEAEDAAPVSASEDVEIRDIPDEEVSQPASPMKHQGVAAFESTRPAGASARLSAFHDRKLMGEPQSVAPVVTPSSQMVEEAIRLGRAPSKRVRRSVSEAKSAGEAVMVEREAPRRASGSTSAASLAAARHRRKSASSSSRKPSTTLDAINLALVPAMPAAPVLNMRDIAPSTGPQPETAAPQQTSTTVEEHNKQLAKARSFATSEEAARAKQQELVEREKRHAEKEAKRQAHLQEKYAKKKQSDPLLAARLALAGLQPPAAETMPRIRSEQLSGVPAFRTSMFNAQAGGLQVPDVPSRRASAAGSPGLLAAPLVRKPSMAGSVTSFHTALDAPIVESAAASPKMVEQQNEGTADASFTSKGSADVRPDTSYSIASSLAVDFEFPVPPQRMKEQLSEDGTLLSRAGLQESPLEQQQQQWRERRHFVAGPHRMRTPPRDSSLRHRVDSGSRRNNPFLCSSSQDEGAYRGMVESRTMPKLGSVSPLDSVKQSVALRRSRSVGYNNRDLRRMTREQMMIDANRHPSPKGSPATLQGMGLGIEIDYSRTNDSGSVTPSTVVQRQPIVA